MNQIFISGASMTYGVGGPDGGWADMVKRKVHALQYGPSRAAEGCEVYNFARPGFTAADVRACLAEDIGHRKYADSKYVIVLSVGMNDSRAVDAADNFVSDEGKYTDELRGLFRLAKSITPQVVFVGLTPVDENRTNPKLSRSSGKMTYFTNARIGAFDAVCAEVCREEGVEHIGLFSDAQAVNWKAMLSEDGLHVNGAGHAWIFERAWAVIGAAIGCQ